MKSFKLAIVQFTPAFGNINETLTRLKPLINQAADADLLVLPELANSGYNFSNRDQAYEFSEDPSKSQFVDFLISQCRKLDLSIVSGFNERCGDQIYNSALLLNKGGIQGKYRKIQLFMNEKDYFLPGDKKPETYVINGVKVAMLICFDWVFPELWNGLAARGTDIICHPSNLVLPGKAQQAIPVWAMTNRIFIATANRIGTEGSLTFTGNSIIAAPSGEVLASASRTGNELLMADCDIALSRDKMLTPRNHIFRDRRPEMYH